MLSLFVYKYYMYEVLKLINQLKRYDLDRDAIQACFDDVDKNIDTINGYICRIMLIHQRNTEKCWHMDLDEIIPETCLYACELAQKYIDRELYKHHPGQTRRGYKDDVYVNFQCYCQVMRMRIGLVLGRYLKTNPASTLNRDRKEYLQSELYDGDKTNDLLDVINYNGTIDDGE